jgi:predicted small secreted protein
MTRVQGQQGEMSGSCLTPSASFLVESGVLDFGEGFEMVRSLLALILTVFILSGCNTVHGLGEDVESVGETVSDAAD